MRANCSQAVLENFFEPCILFLLRSKSAYGYEIKRELKDRCLCDVNIGNLYRCLSRLYKQGHVRRVKSAGISGPSKLVYSLTKSGEIYLAEWIRSLKQQEKTIHLLIKNYQKSYAKKSGESQNI